MPLTATGLTLTSNELSASNLSAIGQNVNLQFVPPTATGYATVNATISGYVGTTFTTTFGSFVQLQPLTTYSISVAAGQLTDLWGNTNPALPSVATYVTAAKPTVVSITRVQTSAGTSAAAEYTNANSNTVYFKVVMSESVLGIPAEA